jgi:hypothetical protein
LLSRAINLLHADPEFKLATAYETSPASVAAIELKVEIHMVWNVHAGAGSKFLGNLEKRLAKTGCS